MLATHHSCGAPLFRCKGKIVCPVCSSLEAGKNASEMVALASEEKLIQDKSGDFRSEETKITSSMDGETNKQIVSGDEIYSAKQALRGALISKLRDLQMRMDEEKDPDQVYKILKCIGEILNIFRILE